MPDDTYSIKEMLEEIRSDIKERFDGVDKRLDKIDDKQDKANHRTSKIEMKLWMAIGGGLVILTVGSLLARLYVKDAINTAVFINKQDIKSIEEIE